MMRWHRSITTENAYLSFKTHTCINGVFASKNKIVINCAGNSDLAKAIYSHLLSRLNFNEQDDEITLTVDEVEIANSKNKVTADAINQMLLGLFESDAENYRNLAITQLENIFTIGAKTELLRNMKVCEYCGYISKDYDDMYNHRLDCASATQLGQRFFGKRG